jgi:hypothetical protein
MTVDGNAKAKALHDRIGAMLTKLGQRGNAVHEEAEEYRTGGIDPDTDPDPDRSKEQKGRQHPHAADGEERRR